MNNYFYTTLQDFNDFPTKSIMTLESFLGRKQENFPPYNIIESSENNYIIEMAIAGVSKKDIEIYQTPELTNLNTKLSISFKKASITENSVKEKYIYNGIANRSFYREFVLSSNIVVKDADMENGMLKIYLERLVPESQKPKKIEIGSSKT